MKKWIVIVGVIIVALIGFGIHYYVTNKNSNNTNYEANRTSTNNDTNNTEN